jgi:hypothetical protein
VVYLSHTENSIGGLHASGPTTAFIHTQGKRAMGKYFIAWLLGVPAFALVIMWFFF